MLRKFWAFADACDSALSIRGIRKVLAQAMRDLGFDSFALLTHAPRSQLRSLEVLMHSWPPDAIDLLFPEPCNGSSNPLFEAVERSRTPVTWSAAAFRKALGADELAWYTRLQEILPGNAASAAMRCALVNASFTVTWSGPMRQERMMVAMRMANYAFHHAQFLQRPVLHESERLTAREQECLFRAAVCGEQPKVVARKLGVKASTVNTLRQKAKSRLEADSAEQAVWRMVETRQLFARGRKSKPRAW